MLYYGRIRAPTDKIGVPADRAWPKDSNGTKKSRIPLPYQPEITENQENKKIKKMHVSYQIKASGMLIHKDTLWFQ